MPERFETFDQAVGGANGVALVEVDATRNAEMLAVEASSRLCSREIFNPICFPALATIWRKRLFSVE